MWFSETESEGEEALPLVSPGSPTLRSTPPDFTVAHSARWKLIQRLTTSAICQLSLFAIPSFLRRATPSSTANASVGKGLPASHKFSPKGSTEYLDGVRGLASFIVFVFHYTHNQYPGVNTGYGVSENPSIWQLPIFRFVYSGSAMVSIFFVVSGYVLSHRFVQKIYQRDFETLYSSLTSLTFRRALRLFLPALASCIMAFAFVSLGLVIPPRRIDHRRFHHGLRAFINYIDQESNPWTWGMYMTGFYNPQLWSIALEYRGSMVVFLAVLGLARSRTAVRIAVESGILVHAFVHGRWDVALFMAGMSIAELDVFVHDSLARTEIMRRKSTKFTLIVILIIGLWLSGYPRDEGPNSWGYGFLTNIWPYGGYRRRFWVSISAILLIAPMPYLPSLQAVFNIKLIRYLGKISFSLYLVHGLGNRTIGTWIIHFVRGIFSSGEYWVDALCYVVSMVLYVPVIIWWSDVFWRAIDIPSTNFAKWLESKCASTAAP
jgi:peptidoglycan/LPS O-acetylase OafA/YrhL